MCTYSFNGERSATATIATAPITITITIIASIFTPFVSAIIATLTPCVDFATGNA